MARLPKYTNSQDMQALVHLYFEGCSLNREVLAKGWGKPVKEVITEDLHPTITGLAIVLDLSRMSLLDYGEKEEFSEVVQEAKARVEAYIVQGLNQNVTGIIFNLKNNFSGWSDKSEVKIGGQFSGIRIVLSEADMNNA